MKHFLRLPLLAAIIALSTLVSCSKEESIAPDSQLAGQSQSNDAAEQYFDYRANTYCFTGEQDINLTGLPTSEPCVPMIRKNFVEINGVKVTQTWSGKVDLRNYPSIKTLPYQWNGEFIDRDPRALGYLWKVSFTIDAAGNASASLRWNNVIIPGVTPL